MNSSPHELYHGTCTRMYISISLLVRREQPTNLNQIVLYRTLIYLGGGGSKWTIEVRRSYRRSQGPHPVEQGAWLDERAPRSGRKQPEDVFGRNVAQFDGRPPIWRQRSKHVVDRDSRCTGLTWEVWKKSHDKEFEKWTSTERFEKKEWTDWRNELW